MVNAAIVGSYIYIGKNAVIVRIDISCANVRIYSYVYKYTKKKKERDRERENRKCSFNYAGKEVRLEGLLLHRGWSCSSTGDRSSLVHSFRRQSCQVRRRFTRVHPRPHARIYQELLSTLFTVHCLTRLYVYTELVYNWKKKKYHSFTFLRRFIESNRVIDRIPPLVIGCSSSFSNSNSNGTALLHVAIFMASLLLLDVRSRRTCWTFLCQTTSIANTTRLRSVP